MRKRVFQIGHSVKPWVWYYYSDAFDTQNVGIGMFSFQWNRDGLTITICRPFTIRKWHEFSFGFKPFFFWHHKY